MQKSPYKHPPGTVIKGKWGGSRYEIVRELGSGANGTVYLVQQPSGFSALKICGNNMTVTAEVNVLKSFSKVRGSILGPCLLDVDDWETGGKITSFYVMEYIHGPDMLTFVRKNGESWIGVLLVQLLDNLQKLHEEGWIFGDLKPENLIISGPPPRIRCIDVGGTTMTGRAIKEFTEFFDRGYWGIGSRKAEPAYDLFAAAMVVVNLAYPARFPKKEGGIGQLKTAIANSAVLVPYEGPLIKAISGGYTSASEMKREMLGILSGARDTRMGRRGRSGSAAQVQRSASPRTAKKTSHRLETISIVMLVTALYAAYIYVQLL